MLRDPESPIPMSSVCRERSESQWRSHEVDPVQPNSIVED